MKKKGRFIIGTLVAVILAIAAYLYWNADKAIEVSPSEDGIIKTENTKATQKPLCIGFIPQGNAVFMVKKWQPLIGKSSIYIQKVHLKKPNHGCANLSEVKFYLSQTRQNTKQ